MKPLPWEFYAAAAVGYVFVAQGCMAFIAWFSGWNRLYHAHPCDGDCPLPQRSFCNVFFGALTTYNLMVTVSADKWALHLRTWPYAFSPTHPPVAISWEAISSIRLSRHWYGWAWDVEVRDLPGLRFALGLRAFRFIAPAARAAGVLIVAGDAPEAARL